MTNMRASWVVVALLLGACDSGGGSGDETATTGETPTTGGPGQTDTDTGGETDTDADTDTGGEEPPIECTNEDPETNAAYDLVPENWDDIDRSVPTYRWYDVEESCTVESVDVTDGMWVTRLNCGGDPARIATLSVAAPPSGAPGWSVDETLTLDGFANIDDFGGHESIRLLRGEEELVHVVEGDGIDGGELGLLHSIGAEPGFECGAPLLDDFDADTGRLALHFTEGDQMLVIVDRHRGAFDLGEGRALEIDVQTATSGNCCHSSLFLHVLKRVALAE